MLGLADVLQHDLAINFANVHKPKKAKKSKKGTTIDQERWVDDVLGALTDSVKFSSAEDTLILLGMVLVVPSSFKWEWEIARARCLPSKTCEQV